MNLRLYSKLYSYEQDLVTQRKKENPQTMLKSHVANFFFIRNLFGDFFYVRCIIYVQNSDLNVYYFAKYFFSC